MRNSVIKDERSLPPLNCSESRHKTKGAQLSSLFVGERRKTPCRTPSPIQRHSGEKILPLIGCISLGTEDKSTDLINIDKDKDSDQGKSPLSLLLPESFQIKQKRRGRRENE
jgi:hypothetical protein